MRRWLVVGPEYGTKIDIGLDDGTGPLEYGCDVVVIEAETAEDARILGVKALRAQPYLQRYSDENPFAGVRVSPQGRTSDLT